jgi:type IV secretion system protein VirD4
LGKGSVQESLSRTNRRRLSEDELRRLHKGAQIIITGNLRPILARKVQVFSVGPYRKRIAGNSLYGGKRKLLPVEVKIGWLRTVVTPRGRRAYAEIKRSVLEGKRGSWLRLLGFFGGGVAALPTILAVAGLAFFFWSNGLPNLRWEYAHTGPRHAPGSYVWCWYVGPASPGVIRSSDCPLILFHKTW